MAAPRKTDETKGKQKPFKYAENHEPDEELISFFVENILDCDQYLMDYKDCKGWHSRIHQYYLYGHTLDCTHMKDTYDECKKYLNKGDQIAKDYLVTYEKAKRDFRMSNARANDVWEYRTTPPTDWLKPVETITKDKIETEEVALLRNFEKLNKNSSGIDDGKPEQSDQKGSKSLTDVSKGGKAEIPSDKKGWCAVS